MRAAILSDFGPLEMTAMGVMVVALVCLGVYPQPVLDLAQPVLDSLNNLVTTIDGTSVAQLGIMETGQ